MNGGDFLIVSGASSLLLATICWIEFWGSISFYIGMNLSLKVFRCVTMLPTLHHLLEWDPPIVHNDPKQPCP